MLIAEEMANPDVTLQKTINQKHEKCFIIRSIDLFRKPLMQLGDSVTDLKNQILQEDTFTVIPSHLETELADIKNDILSYIETGLMYKSDILPVPWTPDVLLSRKGVLLLAETLVMAFDLPAKIRPSRVVADVFIALPNLVVMVLTVTRGDGDGVGHDDHDVAAYNASVTRDLTDSMTRFMDESLQIVSGTVQRETLKNEKNFIGRIKDLAERACSIVTVDSLYLHERKYYKVVTALCASISETKSLTFGSGNTTSDYIRFLSKEQSLALIENINKSNVYIKSVPGAGGSTLMVEMARRMSKLGETLLVCKSAMDKEHIRPVFEATITEEEFDPSLLEKYQHIIHETNIASLPKGRRWTFSTAETVEIEEELSLLDLKDKVADLTKEKIDLIEKMDELKIQLREARGDQGSPKVAKKKEYEYEFETDIPKKEEAKIMKPQSVETDPVQIKDSQEEKDVKMLTVKQDDSPKAGAPTDALLTIKSPEGSKETIQSTAGTLDGTPALHGSGHDDTKTKTDQSYQCPLCRKVYKSKAGYRSHVEKKHKRPDLKDFAEIQYNPDAMDVPGLARDESNRDVDKTVKNIKTEPTESLEETTEASGEMIAVVPLSSDAGEGDEKKTLLMESAEAEAKPAHSDAETGITKGREITYQCPLCPKVYKSEAGYKSHVKKIHKRPDLLDALLKKRRIADVQDPSDIQPAKRPMTEETLLAITDAILKGPLLEYDTIKVNTIYCHVTDEKDLVNWPPVTRDEDSRKFIKYRGTRSFASIPPPVDPSLSSPNYWETETDVKLLKSMEWPLLEIGVSEESQVDTDNWIWLQARSWCVRVGDCPTHTTGVCTQIWGDRTHILCHTDTMSSDSGTDCLLRYGVVLDVGRGRLAFLDLNKDICLHKFDIDFKEDVVPMFGVWPVPDWFTLRMKLKSGTSITMTEEKKLMIQKSLYE